MKDGGPAFPLERRVQSEHGLQAYYQATLGMSLRDYFAGQALAGILACPHDYLGADDMPGRITRVWEYADAMIAEREKKGGA